MWTIWSLDRVVILFVSLAYLLIGIQVTLYHYRQNFHHKLMYVPVIFAPIFFLVGLCLSFTGAAWLRITFHICMWLGVCIGFIGFYRHFKGVGTRVGGWEMRNFLIGPPVILPIVFAAIAALGLIALYWR